MSDDMNPTGPSQPSLNQAYETSGNPISKEPTEEFRSAQNAQSTSSQVDKRIPSTQNPDPDSATPSSLARGIHGAPPGEESKGLTSADIDRRNELDAEQMGAPGEGKVASAVERKPGAGGGERGLETDLGRKREEQEPLRNEVQQQEGEGGGSGGVDVGRILEERK